MSEIIAWLAVVYVAIGVAWGVLVVVVWRRLGHGVSPLMWADNTLWWPAHVTQAALRLVRRP